ncbi:uncharacterized protein G2W53_045019 [Senna tora]|uniref:Uncharacterized protein n=1 Tax=Senna tora TaxID=362788 RepID=A0A834VWV0_9FABA|nr:uncharacterized protein G2W53_045019 [Senna tora]
MGDVSSHVYTHFEPKTAIESQKNLRMTSLNVLSHKCVKRMPSRCIGNPSGSNGRMGLVITWEVYQVMSKHILNRKPRLNVKRIPEAQVRTCCRTKNRYRISKELKKHKVERVVAQVSQTDPFALYWESEWI